MVRFDWINSPLAMGLRKENFIEAIGAYLKLKNCPHTQVCDQLWFGCKTTLSSGVCQLLYIDLARNRNPIFGDRLYNCAIGNIPKSQKSIMVAS